MEAEVRKMGTLQAPEEKNVIKNPPEMIQGMLRYSDAGMDLNTVDEIILGQIKQNIRRHLPQVQPYPVQEDVEIAIIGGGPSAKTSLPEIKDLAANGVKLIAVNGSHNWLIEQGLQPSIMVMVDAREFNTRFIENTIPSCKYLLASQCHPKAFDMLEEKGVELYIWHAVCEVGETGELAKWYLGKPGQTFHLIMGGSTVVLRAIWLMRVLGYAKQHIFGFDSCLMDGEHHAYSQPENDASEVRTAVCAGRKFLCTDWMLSQAQDFQRFVKGVGGAFELQVHGNGLIAWMIEQGAEAQLNIEGD